MDYFQIDRKLVLDKLNETEQSLVKHVKMIEEWAEFQPHLPKIDARVVECLLLKNHFQLEKVKSKLDSYYAFRTIAHEFFEDRDPCDAKMHDTYDVFGYAPMKTYTPNLERVYVMKFFDNDVKKYHFVDTVQMAFMLVDTILDLCTGELLVLDLANMTVAHLASINVTLFKKAFRNMSKGYLLRLKAIHLIHGSKTAEILLNLLKMTVKAKVLARIHIHENLESLHKVIPKSCLPREYGGTIDESVRDITNKLVECMKDNRERLMEQAKIGTDESKRPHGTRDDASDLVAGVDGSFKQLNVD